MDKFDVAVQVVHDQVIGRGGAADQPGVVWMIGVAVMALCLRKLHTSP